MSGIEERVFILFAENLHYGTASVSRVVNYAKGLKYDGINTEVIMPFIFVNDKESFFFSRDGVFQGVYYHYLTYLDNHPKKIFSKPKAYTWYVFNKIKATLLMLIFLFQNRKTNCTYLIYEHSIIWTFLICLLSSKKNKTILEVCEIPFFDKKGIKKKILRWLKIQFNFKLVSGCIVISKELEVYVNNIKRERMNIIEIPILIDENYINQESKEYKGVEIKIPYIIHTGSLTEQKDGILGIIKGVNLYRQKYNKEIYLYCTGYLEHSSDKERIESLIHELGLNNFVFFLGFLPKENLRWLQMNASMAILNKISNEQNTFCFPTKLGEYLISGVPTIVSAVGPQKNFLKHLENAYLFDENDFDKMADGINLILMDIDLRNHIVEYGKKLAFDKFATNTNGVLLAEFLRKHC